MNVRSVLFLACALPLAACQHAPSRESPLLERAFSRPTDAYLASVAPDRRSWAYTPIDSAADWLVLDGDVPAIARAAGEHGLQMDVARDGTAVVCGWSAGVQLYDGTRWATTPVASLAGGDNYVCVGAVTFEGGETWLLFAGLDGGDGVVPPDRLCVTSASGSSCEDLAGVARSLARTPEHVWWIEDAELVARGRGAEDAPLVVAPLDETRLQGDPLDESVLAWADAGVVGDPPIERIAIDGTRSNYLSASEGGGYADVWLTSGGRVLAADVLYGGHMSCSSGWFGAGGGCGTVPEWYQLVVYELGPGAPVELGHVDFGRDVIEPWGVERDGIAMVFAGGDAYVVP